MGGGNTVGLCMRYEREIGVGGMREVERRRDGGVLGTWGGIGRREDR